MSRIAVAGLQLEAVNGDNTDLMEGEIDAALKRFPWLEMVVTPELNACGTSAAMAEPMPGPGEQRFRGIARRHGIWLIPGSMFESAHGKVYNVINDEQIKWFNADHQLVDSAFIRARVGPA